jgi:hypothetical protein
LSPLAFETSDGREHAADVGISVSHIRPGHFRIDGYPVAGRKRLHVPSPGADRRNREAGRHQQQFAAAILARSESGRRRLPIDR